MGAFRLDDDRLIIIRNHENSPGPLKFSPFGKENELLERLAPEQLYDYGQGNQPSLGGTTTLVYNETTGEVESQFLSLAGTNRNCAGGVTPWGTWLTCEEDVTSSGGTVEQDHGFVFEVPANPTAGLVAPRPIKAMGRFNHEAVVVDPATGIVYQTEDAGDGLIYRFIPNVKGDLHQGGRLQALIVSGQPSFDTRNWEATPTVAIGEELSVGWMDIDPDLAQSEDLRLRGFELGAARFARGEGIWFGDGELFFACTNGGLGRFGQVFRYRPSPAEGTPAEKDRPGQLTLFAESPDKTVLHMCDNLTVAPWGDLLLCEDNGELNHIRGINPAGEVYDFAVNRGSGSEFAGVVFSPSGKTLFVNVQESGETVAVTGDWGTLG